METILNIYLKIDNGFIVEYRAESYQHDGSDDEKIEFLKSKAKSDFYKAKIFNSPVTSNGKFMKYRHFAKLEDQGMHFQLFEEIFQEYKVPQNPLICVTPIVDGEIISG